jgi:hypothetical protein
MENISVSVRRDQLRDLFECLLQRLNDEIELETDYYLTITTDEWDQVEESPEPAIGSLRDDWHDLRRILDEGRPFTAVDCERVAAVLKAISEEVLA